jgi:hypothetical protein
MMGSKGEGEGPTTTSRTLRSLQPMVVNPINEMLSPLIRICIGMPINANLLIDLLLRQRFLINAPFGCTDNFTYS